MKEVFPSHIARAVIGTRYFQSMIRMLEKRGIYDGKGRLQMKRRADGLYIQFTARVK